MKPARVLINQRGDTNLVVMAVALPLLLLLVTAATDIARIPIVKQQLETVIHSSFDTAVLRFSENSQSWTDPIAGRNWCAWLGHEHPEYNCPDCDEGACSGGKDVEVSYDGASPLKMAVDEAIRELSSSSLPLMAHANADITIRAGIFNLTVDPNGYGVTGVETVALMGGVDGEMNYPFDLKAYLENKLIPRATTLKGSWLTAVVGGDLNRYAHLSVIVVAGAVRTKHFFNFPTGLRLGVTPANGGEAGGDETTILSTMVRPLARSIRLSGPALAETP